MSELFICRKCGYPKPNQEQVPCSECGDLTRAISRDLDNSIRQGRRVHCIISLVVYICGMTFAIVRFMGMRRDGQAGLGVCVLCAATIFLMMSLAFSSFSGSSGKVDDQESIAKAFIQVVASWICFGIMLILLLIAMLP